MRKLCFLVLAGLWSVALNAQLSLKNQNPVTIDFSGALPGVYLAPFSGKGFSPDPNPGQLDSDAWAISGLSDGELNFGQTRTTGDFARGEQAGNVSDGGIYAFDVNTGRGGPDIALGFQPTESDLSPGSITLRILNDLNGQNTSVFALQISYDVYIRNDQNRSTSISFQHSPDYVNFSSEPSLSITSPQAPDASPTWVKITRSIQLNGLNLPKGRYFYLRWLIQDVEGNNSRDEFALDNITVEITTAGPPTPRFFRSIANGSWTTSSTWESSFDGIGYAPATLIPDFNNSDSIIIQAPNTVALDVDLMADQLRVDAGATLVLGANATLTINNSSGLDFLVLGVFQDNANSSNGIAFASNATWRLGAAGTIIKTSNSGAAAYRDFFEGGIAQMPAGAQWIQRYTGAGDPALATSDMVFPNLHFESVAGPYLPAAGFGGFQGSSKTAKVLGNLHLHSNGNNTVNIINANSGGLIQVLGNTLIEASSSLVLIAGGSQNGFDFRGNLLVEGRADFRLGRVRLGEGSSLPLIGGQGDIDFGDLEITSDVQFDASVEILGELVLDAGKIILNAEDLLLGPGASVMGASPVAYIQTNGSGSLLRDLSGPVFFPIGRSSYNPASLSGATGVYGLRVVDARADAGSIGAPMVQRSWYLTAPGNAQPDPVSIQVFWNASDQEPGFNPLLVSLSANQSGNLQTSVPAPAQPGVGEAFSTGNLLVQAPALIGVFSQSQLPVELGDFQVSQVGDEVLLDWHTLSEESNEYFAVERSVDGSRFEEIGRLAGRGNSLQRFNYRFVDSRPLAGLNYYRLRQVDFDGQYDFSPIRSVMFEGQSSGLFLRLYPNPVSEVLRLERSSPGRENDRYLIVDPLGRPLRQGVIPAGATQVDLPVAGLPAGAYSLVIPGIAVKTFVKRNR